MENNQVTLKKIPLKTLIDVLTRLWGSGADYIDIVGIPNEIQDNIGILVQDDYLCKEEEEGELDIKVDSDKPLKDDDLDKLI